MAEVGHYLNRKFCQFKDFGYLCTQFSLALILQTYEKREQSASFLFYGNLRTPTEVKTKNVVQLFPRLIAWTSVIFRFQGFSGPPLEEYERVCASFMYEQYLKTLYNYGTNDSARTRINPH